MSNELKQKFVEKKAKVAVIGLGYVGLPLAVELASVGFQVHGIDVSKEKVEKLKKGQSYVMDVDDVVIRRLVNKNLFPTTDYSVLKDMDAISICVPTPLNKTKDPDMSYITAVVDQLVRYLTPNTLVVLESTTYPGTTEELIANVLEEKRGFKAGEDIFICYSPERVDPGNKKYTTKNTPKVMGGITPRCLELGLALYQAFLDHLVPVSSTSVAEMVKLLENTFRSVNIALVNELTMMCDRMGINVWEVIEAASTKPFGFMPFYPGPGIGGHCIPLDPMYLSWKAKMFDFYNRFIELAQDVNGNMPRYVLQQIADILNEREKAIKSSRILLIGLAYKKDVDDLRESPALELYKLLDQKGAKLSYHDPYVPCFAYGDALIHSVELTAERLKETDLVVIATDHSNVDYQLIVEHAPVVYDTRNATRHLDADNVILLGGQKKSTIPYKDPAILL